MKIIFSNTILSKIIKSTSLLVFSLIIAAIPLSNKSHASNYQSKGHYLGLDLLKSNVKFYERYIQNYNNQTTYVIEEQDHNSEYGVGINYKYYFNFNNFFIAPGVFFENNETTADTKHRKTHGDLRYLEVDNRFGVKTDVGYDINKYFSPYLTGGFARINYETGNIALLGSELVNSTKINSSVSSWYYGIGFKSNIYENINISFEFNRHKFDAKAYANNEVITNRLGNAYNVQTKYDAQLNVLKFGLSYNF